MKMNKLFWMDQTSIRSPFFNLALEEAICLNLVAAGFSGGIRLWKNPLSIVLGISDQCEKNIKPEILKEYKKKIHL